MQAIQTKYLGPTNTKGSRIKATCDRGSIIVPFATNLDMEDAHTFAVKQLVQRFCEEDLIEYKTPIHKNPWNRTFVTGGLPDGTYAHVFVK